MLPDLVTMGGLLSMAAVRWPDSIAIDSGDGRRWTFPALAREARRVSAALLRDGIGHGDRIAIWAPNMAEWIFIAAGAEQIGAVVVPLNTRFKGREAGDILLRSKSRLLFAVDGFPHLDIASLPPLPDLERIIHIDTGYDGWLRGGAPEAAVDSAIAAVGPDDIVDILYTSGTTGRPKGAMSAHAQNLRSFEAWSEAVGLRAGDRYLIINPFFHSFGYKAGWVACLLRGATAYPVQKFDPAETLATIAREKIGVLPGPPTIFQTLLDVPARADHDLSSLRLAVTGAAAVPPALIRRMRDELGISDVLTAYGLTESCGVVSATHAGDPPELVAESCGTPIPGVEVRIVSPDGTDMPTGAAGELLVRGFNVMKGYLDDPVETAKTIDADGWLHTGDIATRDARGYLRITDRAKDMFISGGFNCYPAELESIILEYPEVARVAVVGRPDARMGEVGHAVIVPRTGATRDSSAFLSWCRANMANYKAPRSVEWVDELPTNAAGKVQRFLLR